MLGGVIVAPTGWAAGQGQDGKDFPGIEALMSPEDYARAGLDKLTPAERQALDAWLVRYTAGDAEVVRETSKEVKEAATSTQIEARIVPPFAGWDGKTVFRLDNGQVWRQRLPGQYRYTGEDTAIVIKKNFFGFYVLTHTATGRSIGVELVP
jgi:hypothetical protein